MTSPSPWTESRPPRRVVAEEEFKPLLASQAHDLLMLANGFLELTPEQWTQRQLYHLSQASTDLETYLDDYGAKENRQFFKCRELIAILRWSSAAMSGLVHLHARIGSYQIVQSDWINNNLDPLVRTSALELGDAISRCLKTLRSFWKESGMVWPDAALRVESLGAAGPSYRLMRDRDEQRPEALHTSQAARLVGRFIHLASQFDANKPYRVEDHTELREIMDRFCREEQCRRIESQIHNLQSVYDSEIAGCAEEGNHPALRKLRGAASISLHLFEAATALSHLYGRHKMDSFLDSEGKVILGEIEIGKIVINTCSICAYNVLNETVAVADELLKELTEVESKTLEIPEGVSLHARPISLIVSVVNQHRTPVEAEIEGDKCSAASIMQLLVMAGGHPNVKAIRFTGDRRSLRDLELLFAASLGEDGFDKIPKELSYLVPSVG